MKALLPSRRGFLAMLLSLLSVVGTQFRRLFQWRHPFVGDWTMLEYICDGKRVAIETMYVAVSFTSDAMTMRIRIQGHPDHIERHNYSIQTFAREMDVEASDDGTFKGVYSDRANELTLAWDTIGEDRPQSVDAPPRFGLNRMVLVRKDAGPTRCT